MPAIAAFALATDGSTGTITLNPTAIDAKGVAHWSSGESILDARTTATQSVRLPVKGGKVSRVQVNLNMPIMDTTDTTLKIGEVAARLEVVVPKNATAAQREKFVYMAKGLMYTSLVGSAVQDLVNFY